MKYERLTNSETAKSMRDNGNTSNPYYVRLAELEDKIENGTLVELPYKLGDTVWFIREFLLFMGCPNIAIKCGKISRVIVNISNEITYAYNVNVESTLTAAGYETYPVTSDVIFLTKDEAEKRLEELRGENK